MTQIANAYAQGLYALAREEGVTERLLEELRVLNGSFEGEPDYLRLLSAPSLTKEERCGILDDSFRERVHPYVLNFMKILTEKGYIRHFGACCRAYERQYDEENGILPVRAVTAVPLTADQSKRLADKLETVTGKTIRLTNRVEPGVLGGVRLDYDGKRVDGTVQNRLDSVRRLLQNTVL